MPQIIVTAIDEYHVQVTVIDSSNTTHQVSIEPNYALKLAAGKITTTQADNHSVIFVVSHQVTSEIML